MCTFLGILLLTACSSSQDAETIQVKQWEKVTLTFAGPQTSEDAEDNPFLNYRLEATFSLGDKAMIVPGFYAADGNAAESSTHEGNIWQVRFRPDQPGTWDYTISFRKGDNIAISEDMSAGEAVAFDGAKGKIEVSANPDSQGRLQVTGDRYLKYANADLYFLKGGADSPENFLGYHEFDGTMKGTAPEQREGEAPVVAELHKYEPHIADWKTGDPTWQNGKGKGIIGALNYLASKGMNSVYFLTMNIEGDGKDVWPYTGYDERFRFDCSKLDQWEIVFDHMDQLGLMLHVVLQETENEKLLDEGNTNFERKIYLRELIARFAHHLAITWNMGEENGPANFSPNGQTTVQQKAMVAYVKAIDPYQNFAVIHSHSNPHHRDSLFDLLLGFPDLDGMSIQSGNPQRANDITKTWLQKSREAGKPWIMCFDELGPHWRGVDPDDRSDNNQDTVRGEVLWGNLMAGGAGVEWYFGYRNHNNDLGCEDWRSRDRVWDFTRHGLNFFHDHLPFHEMNSHNELVDYQGDAYCFAKPGEIYAVYIPKASQKATINLEGIDGNFDLQWFDPRNGGALQKTVRTILPGGTISELGNVPDNPDKDWVALISKQ